MDKHLTGSKFMLFLMIWFIIAQFLMSGALGALGNAIDVDISVIATSPWYIILMQLIALLLPLVVWVVVRKEPLLANMPNWALGGKNIIIIVALSFLLQPAMMVISGISSLFFTNYVSEVMYNFMTYPLWLIILAMAATPAICEELVFRGYLQSQHSNRTIKQAALLNGLFFGIIHFNMQQFAYAFVMGIIFAYMVYYTRSIWAGILPHFIVNATQGILGRAAFMASAELQAEQEAIASVISAEAAAIILFGVITLFLSPVIFILARAFIQHNRWRVESETPKQPEEMPRYDGIIYPTLFEGEVDYNANVKNTAETKPSFFDQYVIWVIVVFIAVLVLLNMLTRI
ncbi:MAG: CPBP family intramembrane metalloprotease [Defluviitaleaceae bacterium]|nr:CPBP family intramembrane metalloprotease [Defluviitaleaceae bacterium]